MFVSGGPAPPPTRFIELGGDPSSSAFHNDEDNHPPKSINYGRRPEHRVVRRSCLPRDEHGPSRDIAHEHYIKQVPMTALNHSKGNG
jgi:hypothetical protein